MFLFIQFRPLFNISATALDEMCNFYLMYYMEGGAPLKQTACVSMGPPTYYWKMDKSLRNIPDEDASRLEDTPDNNNHTHVSMIEQAHTLKAEQAKVFIENQSHKSSAEQPHTNSISVLLISLFVAALCGTNYVYSLKNINRIQWSNLFFIFTTFLINNLQ